MPITHTNRKGDTYYLHSGPKRGGGTQFFFSKKKDGTLPEEIPAGYGIHEHPDPDGMVYVRRKADQLVTDDEIQLVRASLPKPHGKFSHTVDFKKDTITIHEAQVPQITPMPSLFSPSPERIQDFVRRNCHYMPMMRFVLQDRSGNIFQTERYGFRGSIDDWIPVGSPGLLPSLTKKFVVHLGKDSIFELF